MLLPGTIVGVNCGLYQHVGLITDEGTILHSSKQNGRVSEDLIASVLEGREVRTLGFLDWPKLQRAKMLGRSKIGQRWTPFDNCEHFISEICTGTKNSPQLQFWAVVGVAVIMLFLIPQYVRSV